jgi:hypothetical protein
MSVLPGRVLILELGSSIAYKSVTCVPAVQYTEELLYNYCTAYRYVKQHILCEVSQIINQLNRVAARGSIKSDNYLLRKLENNQLKNGELRMAGLRV